MIRCEVEDFELGHEGACMCSGSGFAYESDDAFVCSDEWLYICFAWVIRSPDRDVADQMWIYVLVVLVGHSLSRQDFFCISEGARIVGCSFFMICLIVL